MRFGQLKTRGQSTTETIVLLPLFFFLGFGALQAAQLGITMLIADYAAAAIARQVVQDGLRPSGSPSALPGSYNVRFQKLMAAGMKNGQLMVSADRSGIVGNVTVHACADVSAWPLVGTFVRAAIRSPGGGCGAGGGVLFNKLPGKFVVQGKSTARMNYMP
jgi:hypothetical protein